MVQRIIKFIKKFICKNKKPTYNEEMDSLTDAVWGCTKLDEELGLHKSNTNKER